MTNDLKETVNDQNQKDDLSLHEETVNSKKTESKRKVKSKSNSSSSKNKDNTEKKESKAKNKIKKARTKPKESLSSVVWQAADALSGDGVAYTDFLAQVTYLLFLKMEYDNRKFFLNDELLIPQEYRWETLLNKEGDSLMDQYETILRNLSQREDLIGNIFKDANNKITKPVYLNHLITKFQELKLDELDDDLKGKLYEDMLAKNGNDKRSGAGQYFTPRPLINAIVDCIRPKVGETVCDPACGTGGFLINAYKYMQEHNNDKSQETLQKLKTGSIFGNDNTPIVVTMATMNMYLHGIGEKQNPVTLKDSLQDEPTKLFDVILANPPFGDRPSAAVAVNRNDFYIKTNNNQVNFLQHIMRLLVDKGRAGVVLPDNVLFESTNDTDIVRQKLLDDFNLHTILRLPGGIFYSQGVKANVLFFEKGTPTKELYIYDYRTDIKHTLVTNPLKRSDLDDFVKCYNADDLSARQETYNKDTNPNGRWRKFTIEEIKQRDNLDLNISWINSEEKIEDFNLNELIQKLDQESSILNDAIANLKKVLSC